ncbi:TonB-dependent receptor [Pseudoalteromonas sp. C2R02]|uniref:TonB-dependent receptor n=1 Tax=Pseudoalteromonas sp. C2R02 TaxID=2841565 RepID=UPI001C0A4AB3|nr:TonB-dependent receptor [Pseudoalteromonas sp. C2R02]
MLTKNFKLNLLTINIAITLSAGISNVSYAEQTQVKEDLEVIEVRGIRRSLAESVNSKRFADGVVDAVSAEDIGKFPDSDVGEALGRIPGVAVNRQFGQGQQVSIRGASNQLTLTTLNGQNVSSTGWYDQQAIDRTFNYSLLPPQMISAIEVHKSSQADLVEGGVGGTVNVKTRKPFDMDSGTTFFSVEGDYSTATEEAGPGVSGLYNFKNEDEDFAVLVALAWEDSLYARSGNESSYEWNGAESINYFEQARERTAFDVTAQYTPTDNTSFTLHYMNLDLKADNHNNSLFIFSNTDNCQKTNADGTCVIRESNAENAPATAPYMQTFARNGSMNSQTIDLEFEYEGDSFVWVSRLGKTQADGGTDLTTNHGGYIGTPEDIYGTIDASGDYTKFDLANPGWTVDDFTSDVAPAGWATERQPNTDEELYFQSDFKFYTDLGAITSIKTGVRFTDHKVEQRSEKALYAFDDNGEWLTSASDPTHFWNGTVDSGMQDIYIPYPDVDAMQADALAQSTGWKEDRSAYGTVEEKNFAAYIMANFEAEGIRGNFGLRYISTDASSDYYLPKPGYVDPDNVVGNNNLSETIGTEEANYSDVLPSMNIAFDVSENVIVRASAAQVISRANYEDMFSNQSMSGYNDTQLSNQAITTGMPDLKPFKASQADISIEYYYGDSNLISFATFVKDVSNFTTTETLREQEIGIVDPVCGCDSWTINNKVDGDGGEILGFELQLQHALDNGFGTIVNYTYADSDADPDNFADEIGVFTDSSEHTLNLVGFYENEDFSTRLAYNWRSEYMIRESGFYGNRMHQDYGTLDLTATYAVNDNMTVRFAGTNLLKEDSIQIGMAAPGTDSVKPELRGGYPAWAYQGESTYSLGIDLRY